jgi:hypothetical protein
VRSSWVEIVSSFFYQFDAEFSSVVTSGDFVQHGYRGIRQCLPLWHRRIPVQPIVRHNKLSRFPF